jgi:hypothetical protein
LVLCPYALVSIIQALSGGKSESKNSCHEGKQEGRSKRLTVGRRQEARYCDLRIASPPAVGQGFGIYDLKTVDFSKQHHYHKPQYYHNFSSLQTLGTLNF